MRKKFKTSRIAAVMVFFLVYGAQLYAVLPSGGGGGCVSVNGKPDNGWCDKSDISNKVCIDPASKTPNCYIEIPT